jgi:tetratricopeptide (TPR) repeat protein
MKLYLLVIFGIILLISQGQGLDLTTNAVIEGKGQMHAMTKENGVYDYVNGNGSQVYERRLYSKDLDSRLISNYIYTYKPEDMQLRKNTSALPNKHEVGVYSPMGLGHSYSISANDTTSSRGEILQKEEVLSTNFFVTSQYGNLSEIVSDSRIKTVYNRAETNQVGECSFPMAETDLTGKLKFDSKLNEEERPVQDYQRLTYYLDSVELKGEGSVDQLDVPKKKYHTIGGMTQSPEQAANFYYNKASQLYDNASQEADDNIKKNLWEQARSNLSEALNSNPQFVLALNLQGDVYRKLEMNSNALTSYNKSLSIETSFDALYGKATAHFSLEQYGEASKNYKKALESNPTDLYSLWQLGLSYYYLEMYAEAEASLQKALHLASPDDAEEIQGHIDLVKAMRPTQVIG